MNRPRLRWAHPLSGDAVDSGTRDAVAAPSMEDQVIKIKKPAGNQGGFFEWLKSFFSWLYAWLAGLPPTARAKRPALQSKPRKALPRVPTSGDGNSVIRIRIHPTDDGSTVPTNTPIPGPPATIRPPRGQRRKKGRINLDAQVRICKACGEGFAERDQKARCISDSRHFVHQRCVEIMKHKCPYCGGRLV